MSNDVSFSLISVQTIKANDIYGGNQIKIMAKQGHFKKIFSIDVASGDTITPNPSLIQMHSIITNEDIEVYAYSIESIVSEKIHALIENGILNSRMKDYYDIYMLVKTNRIDFNLLNAAIVNTFFKRKVLFSKSSLIDIIDKIDNSNYQRELFLKYSITKSFANNLDFDSIIDAFRIIAANIKERPN